MYNNLGAKSKHQVTDLFTSLEIKAKHVLLLTGELSGYAETSPF